MIMVTVMAVMKYKYIHCKVQLGLKKRIELHFSPFSISHLGAKHVNLKENDFEIIVSIFSFALICKQAQDVRNTSRKRLQREPVL